jgi:hypothetical protein
MLKIQYFTNFFLQLKSSLLAKSLPVVKFCFCRGNTVFNFTCTWKIYRCIHVQDMSKTQNFKMLKHELDTHTPYLEG